MRSEDRLDNTYAQKQRPDKGERGHGHHDGKHVGDAGRDLIDDENLLFGRQALVHRTVNPRGELNKVWKGAGREDVSDACYADVLEHTAGDREHHNLAQCLAC